MDSHWTSHSIGGTPCHHTYYNGCNYSSILALRLFHVSKRELLSELCGACSFSLGEELGLGGKGEACTGRVFGRGWFHYNEVIMGTMASQITFQPHDCLFNRLFGRRSKKTSKFRVTGLCAGNSPVTGEFPAQMASNAENVSIWWRHHVQVPFPLRRSFVLS